MRPNFAIFATSALLALAACSSPAPADTAMPPAVERTAHHGHDHAANDALADNTLHGCPMHKEMIGSQGDRCPKCNYMEMPPVTWSLEGIDTMRVTSLPDYNPPQ